MNEEHEHVIHEAYGYAKAAHREQRRKYTGEPYFRHCLNVANIVTHYTDDPQVVMAAVLHDTIEDTSITYDDIAEAFGKRVADLVLEVTDVSRPENGNRDARKALDRDHLAKSSPDGATIKLADLIDNTQSIVQYDPNFARVYLAEKERVLPLLKHGNPKLWGRARQTLQDAQTKLVHRSLVGSHD